MQVPPDGHPIALLADRQTAGGYPVIVTVVSADLPLLAQCLPGASGVRFELVSDTAAADISVSASLPGAPRVRQWRGNDVPDGYTTIKPYLSARSFQRLICL